MNERFNVKEFEDWQGRKWLILEDKDTGLEHWDLVRP